MIKIKNHKNIEIKGVMTILPQNINNKKTQKLYFELKKIQKKIQKNHYHQCRFVSMGMSGDYKDAILMGATHIRIGTLLYGKRNQ